MRGRAAPTPLDEIGRLLIAADHGKPRHREQAHFPAPSPGINPFGVVTGRSPLGRMARVALAPCPLLLRAGLRPPVRGHAGRPRSTARSKRRARGPATS